MQEYLSTADLDYASVDRASKACGPLYIWAQSQINYSAILRKVKPLRDEVESLSAQQAEAVSQVNELETAIGQYKAEYASAIRDTETIRSEMTVVTRKVARAENLLTSLNEEKGRWEITSTSFDNQMSTLIGDCLLAASFLTYHGTFDYMVRQSLFLRWCETLEQLNIPYRPDMDLTSYLSTPAEQLLWKSDGMSSDVLALQNCIILERFSRFPMVVDPSGQVTSDQIPLPSLSLS